MKEEFWAKTKVTDRTTWTDGLFTLRLDTALDDFQPGQFVSIGLDGEEKRIHRLFSIASAPGEPLEFFVVRVDGGELSPRLDELQPGDDLWVHMKANGVFVLDRVPDAENLWLMGTGTGLAPYVSMLRTATPWSRFRQLVLVQGTRLVRDLAYREEMNELSKAHGDRLSQVHCVTREEPDDGMYHGRIPSALEDGKLMEMAGVPLEPDRSQVLLCGSPEMIKQLTSMLEERGFKKNSPKNPGQISFERYW